MAFKATVATAAYLVTYSRNYRLTKLHAMQDVVPWPSCGCASGVTHCSHKSRASVCLHPNSAQA